MGEHPEESWHTGWGWSVGSRSCRRWAAKGRLGGCGCSHQFSLQAGGGGWLRMELAAPSSQAAVLGWGCPAEH